MRQELLHGLWVFIRELFVYDPISEVWRLPCEVTHEKMIELIGEPVIVQMFDEIKEAEVQKGREAAHSGHKK